MIEVCIGDRSLLVLEEPTLGLDVAQKRIVYELINRLKQHRVIIIDTQDDELIDLLATQVVQLSKEYQLKTLQFSGTQQYSATVVVKSEEP